MITQTQFKRLDNRGIVPFTVKEDVSLELLTDKSHKEGCTRTFLKGGNFNGELVQVRVRAKDKYNRFVPYMNAVGLMVKEEDGSGYYLVPINNVTDVKMSNVEGSTSEGIDRTNTADVNSAIDDVSSALKDDKKKYFGFTAKQLVIIGVLVLIARNI